ncbi:unnamed protein product [Caenorhabditis nigoni]
MGLKTSTFDSNFAKVGGCALTECAKLRRRFCGVVTGPKSLSTGETSSLFKLKNELLKRKDRIEAQHLIKSSGTHVSGKSNLLSTKKEERERQAKEDKARSRQIAENERAMRREEEVERIRSAEQKLKDKSELYDRMQEGTANLSNPEDSSFDFLGAREQETIERQQESRQRDQDEKKLRCLECKMSISERDLLEHAILEHGKTEDSICRPCMLVFHKAAQKAEHMAMFPHNVNRVALNHNQQGQQPQPIPEPQLENLQVPQQHHQQYRQQQQNQEMHEQQHQHVQQRQGPQADHHHGKPVLGEIHREVGSLEEKWKKLQNNIDPEWFEVDIAKPVKVCKKILIPIYRHPNFNFIGKVLGPKGATLQTLCKTHKCHIYILGRGSTKDREKEAELLASGDPQHAHFSGPLHVKVETVAPAYIAYARVAAVIEESSRILQPIHEDTTPAHLKVNGSGEGEEGNTDDGEKKEGEEGSGRGGRGGGRGGFRGGFRGGRGGFEGRRRGMGRGRGGHPAGSPTAPSNLFLPGMNASGKSLKLHSSSLIRVPGCVVKGRDER